MKAAATILLTSMIMAASAPVNYKLAEFEHKVGQIMIELKQKGWKPKINEQFRSVKRQKELVKKGFSTTMRSKHLCGLAVDIIDKRYLWNIPIKHQFWKDLGTAARKYGLTWGGDWRRFVDVAHVESKRGC
jgi:hypothetical protein